MRLRGINSFTLNNILKELNEHKFLVSVPRIALANEVTIAMDGEPVSFMNGEAVKGSINNRDSVMLPLSFIIDISNDGYSIYFLRKEDIKRVVDILNDILDKLEKTVNSKEDKVISIYNYIEEYYNRIISTVEKTLRIELERSPKTNSIGLGDDVLLNKDNNRTELFISTLNLDDIKVK